MIAALAHSIFVEPWPFWAGGVIIGLLVPLLYYYYNTALGVSTGYGNLAKMIFPVHRLGWFKSQFPETINWRVYFMVGIVLGGFLSARLAGRPLLISEMGQFTVIMGWPSLLTALYFFAGGILLGLGARIAGGCTSGHSIHGIANLHLSSIFVTVLFLAGGVVAANMVRVILLGGGN